MNDYEKSFVLQMERLIDTGYDFQAGTRGALERKFGGASDVLLRDMSEVAKIKPREFVKELSRVFGRGSMGFLEPISEYGRDGLFPPINPSQPAYEAIIAQLGPPTGPDQDMNPLHNWRIKDQEGKYPDEVD